MVQEVTIETQVDAEDVDVEPTAKGARLIECML